jgi:uncharacterized protein (TIGR03067 family)
MFGRNTIRSAGLVMILVLAGCSRPANNPLEDSLKSFAGSWKVLSLDRAGKAADAAALKSMSVHVEGDRFRLTELGGVLQSKEDVAIQQAKTEEFVLQPNPAKSGEIDLVHVSGVHEGKTRLGVFNIEGEKLQICVAAVGEPRPAQIAPGSGATLYVLQRQQ